MSRRRLKKLLVLILVPALFGGRYAYDRYYAHHQQKSAERSHDNHAESGLYKVLEVHDGDTVTILVAGRAERVRLIGIDAPEMGQRPWGKRAKEHLQDLFISSGMKVRLELDVEERDKYGRLLGYLWAKDGRLVNLVMLEDGYAALFTFPPNVRHVSEFRAAHASARKAGRGIWGKGGLRQKPSDYRKRNRR